MAFSEYVQEYIGPKGFIKIKDLEGPTADDDALNFQIRAPIYMEETTARDALMKTINASGHVLIADNDRGLKRRDYSSKAITVHDDSIFDDITIERPTEKTTLIRRMYMRKYGEHIQFYFDAELTAGYFQLPGADQTVGQIITMHSSKPLYPDSIEFWHGHPDWGARVDETYISLLSQTTYTITFRINQKVEGRVNGRESAGLFVFGYSVTYYTYEQELTKYDSKYGIFSAVKYVDTFDFGALSGLQTYRARDYYNDDATATATMVIPTTTDPDVSGADGKQPVIKCGKYVYCDSEKADYFRGVVSRVEYHLRGGQKLIGEVTIHSMDKDIPLIPPDPDPEPEVPTTGTVTITFTAYRDNGTVRTGGNVGIVGIYDNGEPVRWAGMWQIDASSYQATETRNEIKVEISMQKDAERYQLLITGTGESLPNATGSQTVKFASLTDPETKFELQFRFDLS